MQHRLNRRAFITLLGGAAAWPLAARAQQAERMRRVGVLISSTESDPQVRGQTAAFRQGLSELGWVEGRNVRIDFRFLGNDPNRLKTYAALKSDPALGRAEALRRAMLAYMNDTTDPLSAYPALWAPFVVVGEGARR
jgi:hypothetical protein